MNNRIDQIHSEVEKIIEDIYDCKNKLINNYNRDPDYILLGSNVYYILSGFYPFCISKGKEIDKLLGIKIIKDPVYKNRITMVCLKENIFIDVIYYGGING